MDKVIMYIEKDYVLLEFTMLSFSKIITIKKSENTAWPFMCDLQYKQTNYCQVAKSSALLYWHVDL